MVGCLQDKVVPVASAGRGMGSALTGLAATAAPDRSTVAGCGEPA